MPHRAVVAALALLLLLIVAGRMRRAPEPVATVAATSDSTAPDTGRSARQLGPLRATLEAPVTGTPAIDLEARLAIRRRIEREGRRVYLDSMLATFDSTVIRWDDRPVRVLTVRFLPDSALPDWRAALEDARQGMRAWTGNEAALELRETNDTLADITVQWTEMLGEESQLGRTGVTWDMQGAITTVTMTLAVRQNPDSLLVPSAIRRRVAAHEFGHALGLPHSDREDDVMFRTSPVGAPSRRDRATLQLLYAIAPGPLRTP